MNRIASMGALALAVALLTPPGALGDGGPVPPLQGSEIGVAGSPYRYVAVGAGADTVVKVMQPGAGPAVAGLRVRGHYGLPGVAYGGSTTGLSADGRTLVLAEIPGAAAARVTRLLMLGTPRVAVRARIVLPGFSTVDAISPNGRWLYLIHYASANISRYEVRAYDLLRYRLLAKPVIDPRDRDEAMAGVALTRVMSRDGRWAYTLYVRQSGVPFIHALDTARRRAVCVDLPSLANADIGSARLRLGSGGAVLGIDIRGLTPTLVNTRTFAVSHGVRDSGSAPITAPATQRRAKAQSGGTAWWLIAVGLAALVAVALLARRRAAR